MLYFSAVPIRPDLVDHNQHQALSQFKEQCRPHGLFAEYDSPDAFREMFRHHLTRLVMDGFAAPAIQPPVEESPLSPEAKRLLSEAVQDQHGVIMASRTSSGFSFQTHDTILYQGHDAREGARWRAAVQALEEAGLVEDRAGTGNVFFVSDAGYRALEESGPPAPSGG